MAIGTLGLINASLSRSLHLGHLKLQAKPSNQDGLIKKELGLCLSITYFILSEYI